METIIIIAAVVVLILYLVARGSVFGGKAVDGATLAYESRDYLLSKAEAAFIRALEGAIGDRYRIYSKVRLEDIIQIRQGTESKSAYGMRNRIKSRHIDFVLCDPEDFSIQACVELDDPSHSRPERVRRDAFVEAALNASRIPLARVPVRASYSTAALRAQIDGMVRVA